MNILLGDMIMSSLILASIKFYTFSEVLEMGEYRKQ